MQRDLTMHDRHADGVRPVSRLMLWICFLTGPVLWSLHLVVCEFLLAAGCSTGVNGWTSFTLFGTAGWRVVLLLVTAALGAPIVAAGLLSYFTWRRTRIGFDLTGDVGGAAGRSGWMALAGVLISALFFGGVVLAGLPIFWLSGCT